MFAQKIGWFVLVGWLCLALLPLSAAHSSLPSASAVGPASMPPPLPGTVTNCTSEVACVYAFSNASGTGWANSTVSTSYGLSMALKLPGETLSSTKLSYSTSTVKVTNAYPSATYWTLGEFIGTDVNSGHIVYGTTNTNYTATCHVVYKWCHYTYVTDNGTIVVHFTKAEATATSISCSPTTFHPQQKTSCYANVTNTWNASNHPTGKVHLSDGGSGLGTFSNKGACTLSNGSCSFTFKASDNACGVISLSATYGGTVSYYKSGASTAIDIYVSGGC